MYRGNSGLQVQYDSSGNATGIVTQSNVVYPLSRAPANTLAVVGDSITAHWFTLSAGATTTYDIKQYGYLTWALALSNQRLTVISDQSQGGTYVTSAGPGNNFSVQLTAAIASGAGHLLIMGGLNDIENGVTLAAIKAAWRVLIARAVAAGMRVWWCTESPISVAGAGYTKARQVANMQMNDWIRQYVATSTNAAIRHAVTVVDLYSKAVDPSSGTGDFITNGGTAALNDHPTNVSAYYMGKELARVWNLFVMETPQLVTSNVDNYGYDSGSSNILDNGLFVNSTAGVGTGWTVTLGGAGGNVSSITSRADGFGNDQQLLATWTVAAPTDYVRMSTADLKARVSDGDTLVFMCAIDVSSITNLSNIRVQLTMNGAGIGAGAIGKTATAAQLDTADKAMPEAYTAIYKTYPITYDAATMGALTSVTVNITIWGTAAGGATLKVGRASLRKQLLLT